MSTALAQYRPRVELGKRARVSLSKPQSHPGMARSEPSRQDIVAQEHTPTWERISSALSSISALWRIGQMPIANRGDLSALERHAVTALQSITILFRLVFSPDFRSQLININLFCETAHEGIEPSIVLPALATWMCREVYAGRNPFVWDNSRTGNDTYGPQRRLFDHIWACRLEQSSEGAFRYTPFKPPAIPQDATITPLVEPIPTKTAKMIKMRPLGDSKDRIHVVEINGKQYAARSLRFAAKGAREELVTTRVIAYLRGDTESGPSSVSSILRVIHEDAPEGEIFILSPWVEGHPLSDIPKPTPKGHTARGLFAERYSQTGLVKQDISDRVAVEHFVVNNRDGHRDNFHRDATTGILDGLDFEQTLAPNFEVLPKSYQDQHIFGHHLPQSIPDSVAQRYPQVTRKGLQQFVGAEHIMDAELDGIMNRIALALIAHDRQQCSAV